MNFLIVFKWMLLLLLLLLKAFNRFLNLQFLESTVFQSEGQGHMVVVWYPRSRTKEMSKKKKTWRQSTLVGLKLYVPQVFWWALLIKCLKFHFLYQAYEITVLYSDGSKIALRKTYQEFIELQVRVLRSELINIFQKSYFISRLLVIVGEQLM